ncbi:hypothetical protein, partial [Lactiplantibacillus garii]|uniref:hypothetical protein n=1 Tax=Lactiplantibacillus garii TaxID=2306423 RepID=UPI001CDBD99E
MYSAKKIAIDFIVLLNQARTSTARTALVADNALNTVANQRAVQLESDFSH